MFTHLNTHSYYSLLRGTASPEALCAAVKAAGMDSVALTDTNGLYGLLLFLEAARDHGVRPIIGAEVRPALKGRAENSRSPASGANGAPFRGLVQSSAPPLRVGMGVGLGDGNRATLLVKTQTGYSNLCRILSDWHLNGSVEFCAACEPSPRPGMNSRTTNFQSNELDEMRASTSVDRKRVAPDFSPGRRWDLTGELLAHSEGLVTLTSDLPLLQALRSKVDDLYAELVPGKGVHELLKAARDLGIPPVATNRVHFLTAQPEDYQLHRLLRAIDLNTTLSRLPESEVEASSAYLKTAQQMEDFFFFCPEAIENTAIIADRCRFQPEFPLIFPQFEGLNPEETFARLRQEAYRGAQKRYGEVTDVIRARLEHELALIREKNFASIFLVVQDIVKQSPRTCGRGSAAASIVSYCLEITHVDPIRHNLFFERFLNPGRVDPPDIDVDFAWDERDAVLDYVFRKYGVEHTAMISNHVTFQLRAALHEVAKVYGLPEAEITAVTKRLSGYWDDFKDDPQSNPALRYHDFTPPWPDILKLARGLEDLPRHLSVHCGGVIITPERVSQYVPVQQSVKVVNPSKAGRVRIIQWEKDQAEDAGLVKIDLLGNRSLAVIRDALQMIEYNGGPSIEFARWNPIDDPATQELIARGDTMGVFYVESPATRLLQKKARVGDFDHLVIHSSIIRPAANPYIHDYLERLKGQPYQPLHPLLGDLLSETYGIMVYQEDVSKAAMALAGFEAAEADELRKILSKKHKQKRLADLQRKFVQGAQERGVDPETLRAIWDMILSFAGYSFCKPHSASYALVSFKSAWLKAHYPAEFMAAVISNQGGFYSTFAYLSECRRLGLHILPPDINESLARYWGRDRQVRMGLMQIKGLTLKAMDRMIQERQEAGPYLSFDDFRRRTALDPADVRLLIKAGAFDALEGKSNRASLMWRLSVTSRQRDYAVPGQNLRLFTESPSSGPNVPPYDERTLLLHEKESFGFLVSRHPLEFYRDRLKGLRWIRSCDMDQNIGKMVWMAGWLITGKIVSTKKRELMEFLTFEDFDGLIETVFFPAAYDRYCHLLSRERPFLLHGKVDEDFGAVTLTVEEVRYL